MTRGRKPMPAQGPEIIDVAGEVGAEQALDVMRQQAVSEEAQIRADVYRLGQVVGARQMAMTVSNLLAAADISLLDEIAKSKAYKHLDILHPDGKVRPAENIREFCAIVFKKSYSVFAESRQMLNELGHESFELAREIGLPRAQLRLLVSLPDDERAAVEEVMRDGAKDEVVTLIQSLANKLDESRAQVEELRAELQATQEISAEKTQRIEKLQLENKAIATAPDDVELARLQNAASLILSDVRGGIIGQLRQALLALDRHGEETDHRPAVFMAGLVAQLMTDLAVLRDEFNLVDIDANEHGWIDAEADHKAA